MEPRIGYCWHCRENRQELVVNVEVDTNYEPLISTENTAMCDQCMSPLILYVVDNQADLDDLMCMMDDEKDIFMEQA